MTGFGAAECPGLSADSSQGQTTASDAGAGSMLPREVPTYCRWRAGPICGLLKNGYNVHMCMCPIDPLTHQSLAQEHTALRRSWAPETLRSTINANQTGERSGATAVKDKGNGAEERVRGGDVSRQQSSSRRGGRRV